VHTCRWGACIRDKECRHGMPHDPVDTTEILHLEIKMSADGLRVEDVVSSSTISHEAYDYRCDRDRMVDPLPRPDNRPLAVEPRNPLLFPGKRRFTWEDIMSDECVQKDEDLYTLLIGLEVGDQQLLLNRLPVRNQMVVAINPVLTACTGVNTAYLLNGSSTQAK